MNVNISKYFALAAFLFATAATAQNLDPTVIVNRAYEGKLLEVDKPSLEMEVPDSVQQFDLDFDYSVFSSPYKGSYDFKPYQLLMKPYAASETEPVFYLRAGAGYTLKPEADIVWTAVNRDKFKLNVHADNRSYIGGYRSFKPVMSGNDALVLDRWRDQNSSSSTWKGYAIRTNAGIDGKYDWKRGLFSFDMAYAGLASKDTLKNRSYNAYDMNLRVSSKPHGDNYFMYDATIAYRMGRDKVQFPSSEDALNEHIFGMSAKLGPVLALSHRILFDLGLNMAAYSGAVKANAAEISIVPHYIFSKGKWHADVGLRVAKIFKPEDSMMYSAKDQILYPDVEVRYAALHDAMSIYAKVDGGNDLNTYSDIIGHNPFADMSFGREKAVLDATVKRFAFALGIDGRIARRFSYDLRAGYEDYGNAMLDAAVLTGVATCSYLPAVAYASYRKLYASLSWDWHTERIRFDGSVDYAYVPDFKEDVYNVFKPASLLAEATFEYNWNRRIFAGIDCRYSSSRTAMLSHVGSNVEDSFEPKRAVMPGFADLGLYAEFAASRKLSFWLRGGNLLNMTVQYIPLYAERGINFTAGICLKL